MAQQITTSAAQLVDAAKSEIKEYTVEETLARKDDDNVVLVDIRDPRELEREGRIEGAFHCPRGMLEFRGDDTLKSHDPELRKNRAVILYCAAGGRAALAGKLLKDMGYDEIYNLGGLADWVNGGGDTESA